ncbi:hypothetical protein [Conexibacter sp. CPCC 206217]|nr:hypothetical protein [Conexibacter sp. CPCC 206217]MDO8208792.1 hypothetical protein [Conexibacter sp. CPCC 206217]
MTEQTTARPLCVLVLNEPIWLATAGRQAPTSFAAAQGRKPVPSRVRVP